MKELKSRDKITYARFPQQRKELASLNEIHDHVQVLAVLERPPQSDEKRVFDIAQHSPFVIRMLDLLHLNHLGLLQYLDGIEPLVVLRLHQMDSPEATSAERPQYVEVTQRVLALGDAGLRADASLMLVMHLLMLLKLLLIHVRRLLLLLLHSRVR